MIQKIAMFFYQILLVICLNLGGIFIVQLDTPGRCFSWVVAVQIIRSYYWSSSKEIPLIWNGISLVDSISHVM